MVGREAGCGDQRQDVPGLCDIQEGAGMQPKGTGFFKRGHKILEQRAWASENCPGCLAAGEALTADKFYDSFGGGALPLGCSTDPASCEIFRYRLVHGIATERDSGPQVVDGES
jgi:hypothetical protein